MKRILSIFFLFFVILDVLTAATHIYVSPKGSDMNDGSRKRPLLTPMQAIVKARQMPRKDTLYIHLADGLYRLDETLQLRAEDSGTAKAPTVIVADNKGKAIISGGAHLDMSDRMASLNWWVGHPVDGHRTVTVRQLWRDGAKMPHASLFPLDSLIEVSGISREKQELWVPVESFDPVLDLIYGSRLGFGDDESIMKQVKAEEIRGLEIIACTQNTMSVLRVKNFNIEGNLVKLTFHNPESRLLFSLPELPHYYNILGDYSLVIPGTWYQDPKDGSIVYDPLEEERGNAVKVASRNFTIPILEHLVQLSGKKDNPVHHIIFRGIQFQYSAWNHASNQGFVTAPGGNYRLNGGYEDRQEAAIIVREAHDIEFADCYFSHIGATAIDYEPSCTNGSVTGCHFSDVGGSAIATPVRPASLGFRIQRNSFEDIANEIWFSEAIRSK